VDIAHKQFVPVAGDLVTSLHKRGVFKVLSISHDGLTVAIQSFNISKQQLMDQPIGGEDTKRTELQAKEYKSLIYKGPGVFMNWAMFAHFTHS
jgi:hypothetical protein